MSKDAKGHGSERHAVGIVEHRGERREVHISPSKASVAVNRGWKGAVSFAHPGQVTKVHENMAKAKSRLEAHPGFRGWKDMKPSKVSATTANRKY